MWRTRSIVSRALVLVCFSSALAMAAPSLAQEQNSAARPLVWVLSTGGTIAGEGSSTTDVSNYKAGSLLGQDLVNAVPQIKEVANVRVEQIINVRSPDLSISNWITLANRINQILAADANVAGIVITHGTSTIEETGYFLNLTVKSDRPVVLVGSMRPATAISADGPLNLLNAVRVASSPIARGKGVLIVMNDEISAARDVTKTNTFRVEALRTPELGFLGYVDEDQVTFYRSPTRRHTINSEFDIGSIRQLPEVEILYSYVEPNTAVIQALVASGVRGIVFAGTGAGGISSFERDALNPIVSSPIESRPVLVRSSRVGNGRVIRRDEYDRMGMVPADSLNPQKARILLMLALTKTRDLEDIKRMFAEY
jgi:L-asparaginase